MSYVYVTILVPLLICAALLLQSLTRQGM